MPRRWPITPPGWYPRHHRHAAPHAQPQGPQYPQLRCRGAPAGNGVDEAGAYAQRLAEERNLVFVHPYDDEHIIAGQGTVALEMLEEVPDLDSLVIPIGGGG